jgi:hypothetical protein
VILASALLFAGCRTPQVEPPSEAPAPTAEEAAPLPGHYVRVSVHLTDAATNGALDGATITFGDEALLPSPSSSPFDPGSGVVYDTDSLEGGTYFFRASRPGYRTLAGKVTVYPPPEVYGRRQPPLVLTLENPGESGEELPSMRALILWQKYSRQTEESAHPEMPSRGRKGYHDSP